MTARRDRRELIPNANNPQLLLRLIGLIAAGVRRPRALGEVLEVELRTVQYYAQAGAWLGLLDGDDELLLTRHGLELAFAEPQHRMRHYAAAVWRTQIGQELLAGRAQLPPRAELVAWVQARDPELAEATAERRASALHSLLEPALGRAPSPRAAAGEQLRLPFAADGDALALPLHRPPSPVDLRAGTDDSPDVYARVLSALMEHGELRTTAIRALLEEMGAAEAPVGGVAETALRRGDATREDDRLVITRGALSRAEVAGDGVLVALTDPEYRRWLALAQRPEAELTPMERQLQQRARRRYAAWDRRLLGGSRPPEQMAEALATLLPGHHLESLPVADGPGAPLPCAPRPFLEALDVEGLPVAFPRALAGLAGGVQAVNALLRRERMAPAAVRLPDAVAPCRRVHAGLLHPGEDLPVAVADNFSLRLQLLTRCPALALLGATLLLDRRPDAGLRVELIGGEPVVRVGRQPVGPLMDTFAAFGAGTGWTLTRPPGGGLSGPTLIALARALGVAGSVGRRLVLAEELFARLQEDPESRPVYDALLPLVDRLGAWLQGLDRPLAPR
jgi:hypothetical protein